MNADKIPFEPPRCGEKQSRIWTAMTPSAPSFINKNQEKDDRLADLVAWT
jgi:hypothetical protein